MTSKDGKPCKRCGTSEWHKSGKCKACKRVYDRDYRINNREKCNAITRRWRENNPQKMKESRLKWIQNNPQKDKECHRKWAQNNPDKSRRWSRNNPEKKRIINKIWREKNRIKINGYASARRTRVTNAGGSFTEHEWKELCKHYDYYCLKCGKQILLSKLTADHVVAVSNGGTSNIDNIQPLCQPCNSSKGATNKDYRIGFGDFEHWTQPKLIDND